MRFQDFTKYLEALENASGRIEMYGLHGITRMSGKGSSEARRDKHGRGLALRFPRIVVFMRAYKSAEDATTALEMEQMYAQQRNAKKSTAK